MRRPNPSHSSFAYTSPSARISCRTIVFSQCQNFLVLLYSIPSIPSHQSSLFFFSFRSSYIFICSFVLPTDDPYILAVISHLVVSSFSIFGSHLVCCPLILPLFPWICLYRGRIQKEGVRAERGRRVCVGWG